MAATFSEIERAQRLTRTALLAACALVLGFLETMIPLPGALPGMKLGLSNIAVVIALFLMGGRTAAKVAAFKVLATGFLFGSPLMIAYSAAGTMLALGTMVGLKRIGVSVVAVSLVAAVAHNLGQLLVAAWFLGTWAVLLSAPFLLAAACVTGAATGLVAQRVIDALPDRSYGATADGNAQSAPAEGAASTRSGCDWSDGEWEYA
ncbi:Gx transporter family protein [uncultured Adlercreutzia sp.]|uniref:Gx transporter family protein n=1 Tax=uncultured Adlercreutzia sp. TaxID=875803 RepID=UPI0025DDB40D|nr:Gx transporter family protein [uncultured Adlercreutzia sp.]MCI9262226.1 Gx transporter family protein [Eggerthellaceae bacterium]